MIDQPVAMMGGDADTSEIYVPFTYTTSRYNWPTWYNVTAITNVVLYAQSTVPVGATPYFGLTSAMVNVSAPDPGTGNYRLVVTISGYSFQLISPFLHGRFGGAPITVAIPLSQYH